MAISYKKLWKLLIDKDMMKKDLRAMTGVSTTTMSRLSKDENVSTEILSKICFWHKIFNLCRQTGQDFLRNRLKYPRFLIRFVAFTRRKPPRRLISAPIYV